MENLLNLSLLATAAAMSFPLALVTARFALQAVLRAMSVRAQTKVS
jgi:hypothetical protein